MAKKANSGNTKENLPNELSFITDTHHDIANVLALNYIRNSFNLGGEAGMLDEIYKKYLNNGSRKLAKLYTNKKTSNDRVVILVGSGASKDAGIKTTLDTIKALKDHMNISDEFLEYERQRLKDLFDVPDSEIDYMGFELELQALTKFEPNKLEEKIKDIYKERHIPVFGYEILAHLLKHRYVDAIVNFNFDELLDQSIEDELMADDYFKIISDGDCPTELEEGKLKGRCSLPAYIKPHGTASHRSTLRFTKEAYFRLPDGIKKAIESFCNTEGANVHLIVIGFSMLGSDLHRIILEQGIKGGEEHKLNIYYINWEKVLQEGNDPVKRGQYNKFSRFFGGSISVEKYGNIIDQRKEASVTEEPRLLDEVLGDIWNLVYTEKFKNSFKPRTIGRHYIVSQLLKRELLDEGHNKNYLSELEYFHDRVYLELLLSIARSKGIISIDNLGLAKKYYDLYTKALEKENKANSNKPINKTKRNEYKKWPTRFLQFCKNICLDKHSYSHETFRIEDLTQEGHYIVKAKIFNKKIDDILNDQDKVFTKKTQKRLEGKIEYFTGQTYRKGVFFSERPYYFSLKGAYTLNTKGPKIFKEYLKSLLIKRYEGEEVQIYATNKPNNYILEDGIRIPSILSLNHHTNELLEREEWNVLLVIAESGEWLTKPFVEFSNKGNRVVDLIIADETYKSKIFSNLSDFFPFESPDKISTLPWWLHNQHISLFLEISKEEDEDSVSKKLVGAIYFRRDKRKTSINPVMFNESKEIKEESPEMALIDCFFSYKLKSLLKESKDKDYTISLSTDDYKKYRGKYFDYLIERLDGPKQNLTLKYLKGTDKEKQST